MLEPSVLVLSSHRLKSTPSHIESVCAGVKNLLEDEAITVGGSNHSHATQDLYDAISAGDYPEWKLLIQVAAFSWLAAAVL